MPSDRDAIRELLKYSRAQAPHLISHFLYFSVRASADKAATKLRSGGFSTEQRMGGDGINWLVLAQHRIVPTESSVGAARRFLEEVARDYDGEYDGWEAETEP